MRTFIQLKDNVGWAVVNSSNEVAGSIEVESGNGDFYLKKLYNDGSWSDAPLIRFAEIDDDGSIVEIKKTYYTSEVAGPILDSETKGSSKWINNQWEHAVPVEPVTQPPVVESIAPNDGGSDVSGESA